MFGLLKRKARAHAPPRSDYDLSTWDEFGYLALKGFFDPARVKAANTEVDRLWKERNTPDNPYVIDIFLGTSKESRVFFRSCPEEARQVPHKLNDLFLSNPIIQNLSLDPKLADILRYLLQADPVVCNSLTFEFGSQQE